MNRASLISPEIWPAGSSRPSSHLDGVHSRTATPLRLPSEWVTASSPLLCLTRVMSGSRASTSSCLASTTGSCSLKCGPISVTRVLCSIGVKKQGTTSLYCTRPTTDGPHFPPHDEPSCSTVQLAVSVRWCIPRPVIVVWKVVPNPLSLRTDLRETDTIASGTEPILVTSLNNTSVCGGSFAAPPLHLSVPFRSKHTQLELDATPPLPATATAASTCALACRASALTECAAEIAPPVAEASPAINKLCGRNSIDRATSQKKTPDDAPGLLTSSSLSPGTIVITVLARKAAGQARIRSRSSQSRA
mmetsp:Transcript_23562/g.32163  ORF Transcript_23562/g.32163 Transcript_23562/m.32163 type:complete len:304 (-) Transcript_23562:896-1807(-)